MNKNKKGFTLIELLVVIAIIGILATLAVVSLQQARKSARDAKRIADVKQMQTALELYFNDWQEYPADVISGSSISSSTSNIYMAIVPTGPTPADGDCASSSYEYGQVDDGDSYYIEFCLGGQTGGLASGIKCATPLGVIPTTTHCY
jgi:prepilin-type N-terminal cleavage/methylation domain-containing protein